MEQENYMELALNEAKKAYEIEEIPVGAIIVKDGKVISRAYNQKETKNNPIAHAEILAIERASKKLGRWRLDDCDLYVTLEPCPMCAGAIIQARLNNLYIGTMDPKSGACGSVLDLSKDFPFNHKVNTIVGIKKLECEKILKDFFKQLRNKTKR
jgi:tRNA(adenine34) deaminase